MLGEVDEERITSHRADQQHSLPRLKLARLECCLHLFFLSLSLSPLCSPVFFFRVKSEPNIRGGFLVVVVVVVLSSSDGRLKQTQTLYPEKKRGGERERGEERGGRKRKKGRDIRALMLQRFRCLQL